MATRTSITLIASLAASCAAMSRGALFGSTNSYTFAQARLVQRSLNEHGYPVELTGVYDDRTRAAVTSFQRSHGIVTTGDVDAATARALGLEPSDVTPTRDDRWVQDRLQYDAWHQRRRRRHPWPRARARSPAAPSAAKRRAAPFA